MKINVARLDELFHSALELPAAQRAEFLSRECGDDQAMRTLVEELIDADSSAVDFLEAGVLKPRRPTITPVQSGNRLGNFELRGLLGSGGMGAVYEAWQSQPPRAVAVKVMHTRITRPEDRRRFRDESRLLARLQHPGVVQIFEARCDNESTGPDGGEHPFFVMEFVPNAMSLVEFANQNQLDIDQRLSLVIQLCEAVHHGHQKGVIHRDLKPGNVLVNSDGCVKVIDFGVARVVDPDWCGTTIATNSGQLIGTIPYMSPEALGGGVDAIDTRSDIYAIGVITYQLLTGSMPFDVRHLSIAAAVATIRECEPPAAGKMNQALRGDLETIIAKALHKDCRYRYQSAMELAEDIRRHQSHHPILARPPGRWYRFAKLARRHRAVFAGTALAFVGLVAGLVFATHQARVADGARHRAEHEARRVDAVNAFLQSILRSGNPKTRGADYTVQEALLAAANQAENAFNDEPEIQASLHRTIGQTLWTMGDFPRAEHHLRRSAALMQEHGAPDNCTLDCTLQSVAELSLLNGKHDDAAAIYRELLDRIDPAAPSRFRDAVSIRRGIAAAMDAGGNRDDAIAYLDRLLNDCLDRDERGDETIETIKQLVALHDCAGQHAMAVKLSRQAFEMRIAIHPNESAVIGLERCALGEMLARSGSAEALLEGEQHLRTGIRELRVAYPGDSLDVAVNLSTLAAIREARGDADEAQALYGDALEMKRRLLSDNHPEVATTLVNLAGFLSQHDRMQAARDCLNEALAIRETFFDSAHPLVREVHMAIAELEDSSN